MHVLEVVRGLRVMATPQALDACRWSGEVVVLRFAPDDTFAIGATGVEVGDEHAIVVKESGFVGVWLDHAELRDQVIPHIEWALPRSRPALAQGLVGGVPAKLWLTDERALLLCPAAYAAELVEMLR